MDSGNHYILFYTTIENYVEKRTPFREEHLRLADDARQRGDLLMAGALENPADGAILVFRAQSPEVAEDFAKNDPYVKNGLITKWFVRKWNVVVRE
ncbi:YciI family protein [Litoribacter ruber]|uniref:YciI family protein n=1 Tax=Litoribacter ruber TaxID=702568 RepID=A0AAP2G2D5_9BACT|nr:MULTISPECIES: YciI-like protein [Litoribacter]MBS9525994.1 YciI family protein [Litoribacter alkaliphilus]MBT0813150.1 YciI family protein [Litoribacter ruber]